MEEGIGPWHHHGYLLLRWRRAWQPSLVTNGVLVPKKASRRDVYLVDSQKALRYCCCGIGQGVVGVKYKQHQCRDDPPACP